MTQIRASDARTKIEAYSTSVTLYESVRYERLPASWKRNEACPVPPELAIEMISPDQTIK